MTLVIDVKNTILHPTLLCWQSSRQILPNMRACALNNKQLRLNVNTLVLNVDELWLKGKNRPLYFKALKYHVKRVVKAYHCEPYLLKNESQRYVLTSDTAFTRELLEALSLIPGLCKVVVCRKIALDEKLIFPAVVAEIKALDKFPKTFKIQTKRVYKLFPTTSMELNRNLGAQVLEEFSDSGLRVDVHKPELLIDIKILSNAIYISSEVLPGVGGLPVGTSGHLITMISGGIDSPVASYMMSKRGCQQTFAFFYAYPFVGEAVKEKIFDLIKIIGKYQNGARLVVIPFGHFQNSLSKHCKEEYSTVFFRYYMLQISNMLADIIKADAILTGDALAQVSSQTIGNMALLDRAIERPILRPLVGLNKLEIIKLSKNIKAFETSILPHDDACSMFSPKHPIIKPDRVYWNNFVADNDFSSQMTQCLSDSEVYYVNVKGQLKRVENTLVSE